jgi:hypothetical protein
MRLLAFLAAAIVSAHGVHLTIPAGWQRIQAASPGPVTDPVTLLVVGTTGAHRRASQCKIAAYGVPPTGAVVVVVGWSGSGGSQRSGRWPLAALKAVHSPSFECFSGRGAAAYLLLRGRGYQVNVMVGGHATSARIRQALAVARSFDVVR